MGLFQTKRIRIAVCILLIIPISFLLWRRHISQKETMVEHLSKSRFTENQIVIYKYLFQLHRQCSSGKFDEAQNTFLDLKQTWQYQDVVVKSVPVRHYLPSDSLQQLSALLDLPVSAANQALVVKEIRRINARIAND